MAAHAQPGPTAGGRLPFQHFDQFTRHLIGVPKSELDAKIAAHKTDKKKGGARDETGTQLVS
jgi:hypothetical protein